MFLYVYFQLFSFKSGIEISLKYPIISIDYILDIYKNKKMWARQTIAMVQPVVNWI